MYILNMISSAKANTFKFNWALIIISHSHIYSNKKNLSRSYEKSLQYEHTTAELLLIDPVGGVTNWLDNRKRINNRFKWSWESGF